jgi:cephalosporin-C deacetylase-like acetyl esterase
VLSERFASLLASEGEPLLMYHGWPQNWWLWRKQIPFFAKHFRVIAADIRGFGWSEVSDDGYMKDELAEDFQNNSIDFTGSAFFQKVYFKEYDQVSPVSLIHINRTPSDKPGSISASSWLESSARPWPP